MPVADRKMRARCWSPTFSTTSNLSPPALAGVWETHTVPFTAFAPIFRAKTVTDAPALQLEHVHSVQLMLSKFEADGALNPAFKTGAFRLAVRSIAATGSAVSRAWDMGGNCVS